MTNSVKKANSLKKGETFEFNGRSYEVVDKWRSTYGMVINFYDRSQGRERSLSYRLFDAEFNA